MSQETKFDEVTFRSLSATECDECGEKAICTKTPSVILCEDCLSEAYNVECHGCEEVKLTAATAHYRNAPYCADCVAERGFVVAPHGSCYGGSATCVECDADPCDLSDCEDEDCGYALHCRNCDGMHCTPGDGYCDCGKDDCPKK